jgi:ADP-heptose:LPS heptosyltransferase
MEQGRILLISLSNIGDAIMTTPVLQALHDGFPEAQIDIVSDRRSSDIFLHCPYRGRILNKDKRKFMRGLPALLLELRSTRYNLIVDLRTELIAYLLRADKRLCRWHRKSYGPHSVEKHMGVIRAVHGTRPIPSCIVWPGEDDRNFANKVLLEYRGNNLLSIGPGANWPGKVWPQQNYLKLIEHLRHKFDALILLGDDKDRKISQPIAELSVLPCIDLCGKTTLLQAAAVLEETSLFIGNDSGLGHMASGVNTPTITIFGPGDPARYRPWGPLARCATGLPTDISTVTVDDVWEQLELLERSRTPTIAARGA